MFSGLNFYTCPISQMFLLQIDSNGMIIARLLELIKPKVTVPAKLFSWGFCKEAPKTTKLS